MIINRNFKNSKKADKAAALLALATNKADEPGRCLLAEEMAALVDKSCGKEELDTFMQHLSCCEKCYDQWFTLKKMDDHKTSEDRVYRLSRLKKYSFIGSALAIAASVAVFLNISYQPPVFKIKVLEDAVLVQPETEPDETAVPQPKLETEEMDVEAALEKAVPMAPAVVDSKFKEDTEKRRISTQIGGKSQKEMKGLSVPAPATQSVPDVAQKKAQAEVVGDGYTLMDVDSWLEQLKKNCLIGKQEADFWSKMRLQGKNILEKKAGLLPSDKEQKVLAVLALLAEINTESVTDQCRQILAVLAEDEKSR